MDRIKDKWRASSPADRAYVLAVAGLFLVGCLVRTLGYFDGQNGLWWDEAAWVRRIADGQFGIRPIGYALVSRVLIDWSPTEAVVRAPSYLAGLATLPAFLWLCRGAGFTRRATLLGLFVLAVHPWAVAYSKEFKPYAVELFCHIAILAFSFAYLRKQTLARLIGLGLTALVGASLAWTAACTFPGVLAAVLIVQLRNKLRVHLALTSATVALGTVGLGAIYFLRVHGRKSQSEYWANKYGVFFEGDGVLGHVAWFFRKSWDLAALPGKLKAFWGPSLTVATAGGVVMGVLVVVGLVALALKRRHDWALLFVSPWLLTIATNIIGLWPYGVFRTNLFLLLYPLVLALAGFTFLERLRPQDPARAGAFDKLATAALCVFVLAFAPYNLKYFALKDAQTGAYATSTVEALRIIQRAESAKPTNGRASLFLDAHACAAVAYYTRVHPEHKRTLGKFARTKLKQTCARGSSLKDLKRAMVGLKRSEFWLLAAKPSVAHQVRDDIAATFDVDFSRTLPTGDVLLHARARGASRGPTISAAHPSSDEQAAPLAAPLADSSPGDKAKPAPSASAEPASGALARPSPSPN